MGAKSERRFNLKRCVPLTRDEERRVVKAGTTQGQRRLFLGLRKARSKLAR
jgi:hypothetical protein